MSERAERTTSEAARWVQEAERHFEEGDPEKAIPLLERAYQLTGWQGCLLNLGMAHHALGKCMAARRYYERFLDAEPYTERRAQVASALDELGQFCTPIAPDHPPQAEVRSDAIPPLDGPVSASVPEPLPAAVVSGVEASPHRVDSARRTVAIVGLGLGGAAAVAALIFVVSGEQLDRDAQRLDRLGRSPDNDSVARSLDEDGHRANTLAIAFGAGSVVLLGASVTLLWLGDTAGSGTLSLSVNQGSSRLNYQMHF